MGTFTDQVQGLASEQRISRLEREEKRRQRLEKENAKNKLFCFLDETLATCDNVDITYFELLNKDNKNEIIENITNKNNIKIYLLQNYTSILNLAYKPYKTEIKEAERIEKKYLQEIQEEEEEKEEKKKNKKIKYVPSTFEVVLSLIKCILMILSIPVIFFAMLFYYMLRGSGKRRR